MIRRANVITSAVTIALLIGCGSDTAIDSAGNDAADGVARSLTATGTTMAPSSTTVSPTDPESSTTSTTRWTPPSITWPTTPYTLPPDYGAAPGITRDVDALPEETFARDSSLPELEWTIEDDITIRFDPPSDFRQDPLPLPTIQDYDRANGLFLLERWAVADEPYLAGLSVQANPGDESPLLSRQEFSDSIVTDDLTWYLWNGETVRQTGKPANMGLAVSDDYLFMIHGTPESMRAIANALVFVR